ncbi:Transcriptional regulator [Hoeflea phototrophica DFL-43]|uniref:Transcriptional regulator n=1 Tax=Hoeflea phototrophica (strain DSM 17068 / NCIMB 14078 / DFL-43) TaxID=411684 RepID=A9D0X7_HOEPD|nr:MarR family transcriptional regulator [Hoeflea phototrophica]EDQ35084.2 Transcriptional regulator [Hoeflea phototrophica DFL-43]
MAEALDASLDKPYRLDEQIGFLLRLAGQRHTAIFQDMAPDDLTPTQFATLARLAEFGDCSQNELGRRTAMDVATIKGVVDRLRAKGFVTAAADPDDKRRSTLSLSPDFAPSLPALLKTGHAISEATLAPLTPAERKTLLQLLAKISVA